MLQSPFILNVGKNKIEIKSSLATISHSVFQSSAQTLFTMLFCTETPRQCLIQQNLFSNYWSSRRMVQWKSCSDSRFLLVLKMNWPNVHKIPNRRTSNGNKLETKQNQFQYRFIFVVVLGTVGEKKELGSNQSVNSGFNWAVCRGFQYPNSTELSLR